MVLNASSRRSSTPSSACVLCHRDTDDDDSRRFCDDQIKNLSLGEVLVKYDIVPAVYVSPDDPICGRCRKLLETYAVAMSMGGTLLTRMKNIWRETAANGVGALGMIRGERESRSSEEIPAPVDVDVSEERTESSSADVNTTGAAVERKSNSAQPQNGSGQPIPLNQDQRETDKPFECLFCPRRFAQRRYVGDHVKSMHPKQRQKGKFPCPREGCLKAFATNSALKVHDKAAHHLPEVSNDDLGPSPNKVARSDANGETAPEKTSKYRCGHRGCGAEFPSVYPLSTQGWREHNRKTLDLTLEETLEPVDEVAPRMNLAEASEKTLNFPCPNCDKVYKKKRDRINHIKKYHKNACECCGDLYKIHPQEEQGWGNCEICTRGVNHVNAHFLWDHVAKYCQSCCAAFAVRANLVAHEAKCGKPE